MCVCVCVGGFCVGCVGVCVFVCVCVCRLFGYLCVGVCVCVYLWGCV